MITLTESQWHVRWFRWSQTVLKNFTDKGSYEWEYRSGADLCTFMRTIMLGTFIGALSVCWWGLLAGFVILPFYLFGVVKPLLGVLAVVAGLGGFFLLVFGFITWVPKTIDCVKNAFTPHPGEPTGFGACVWQWLVSIKKRFCPIIKFNEE